MLGGEIHTVAFIKIAEMAYNRCEFIFSIVHRVFRSMSDLLSFISHPPTSNARPKNDR
jgi:hypothetical protein